MYNTKNMETTRTTDSKTLAYFWQSSLRHKRLLWLAVFHPIGAICLNVLTPLFIGKTLALLSVPHANHTAYIPQLVVVAAIGILSNRVGFSALMSLQAHVMSDLQSTTAASLLKRSVGFHNNNIGGKLISDAIDFPTSYSMLANAFFISLLPLVIMLSVGTAIIFVESWMLGLFILGMIGYAFGSAWTESRRRTPVRLRRLKAHKDVTGHMADTVLNVQTVKTFASEAPELQHNQKLNHILRAIRIQDWKASARHNNTRMGVLLGMQIGFVTLAIYLVERNTALLGIGIFAFSFTVTLSSRLIDIGIMLRNIEDGLLQASPMTEILHQDAEIVDKPGAKDLVVSDGGIMLSDMTFRYKDASNDDRIFDNFNLTIKPGEKIGLVGSSGGGKSTFTRLLLRFDDVTDGTIAIDGQDISAVTQSSLRKAISYVPQEPLLFHRTIRENIAYGNPEAGDDEVIAAAEKAYANEFIDKLPEGLDTVVGERGVKLSGGQRQRIAIARAILKDAPILVLDEATSALDSGSELLIQQALWQLMEGRTAIVVAHRLSTIQKMDRIIVLENGAIAEQGSHKQLLKQKGRYAALWAHQSGGFIEE